VLLKTLIVALSLQNSLRSPQNNLKQHLQYARCLRENLQIVGSGGFEALALGAQDGKLLL
jgi:hypothetical protein